MISLVVSLEKTRFKSSPPSVNLKITFPLIWQIATSPPEGKEHWEQLKFRSLQMSILTDISLKPAALACFTVITMKYITMRGFLKTMVMTTGSVQISLSTCLDRIDILCRFTRTKPISFRTGDIVEVQVSFALLPLREKKFKLSLILRSLTLFDARYRQVR